MQGRADTPEKKRAIIERLYRAWIVNPHQRLGQLLVNYAPGYHPNPSLFYVEDEDLVAYVEQAKPLPEGAKRRPGEDL